MTDLSEKLVKEIINLYLKKYGDSIAKEYVNNLVFGIPVDIELENDDV